MATDVSVAHLQHNTFPHTESVQVFPYVTIDLNMHQRLYHTLISDVGTTSDVYCVVGFPPTHIEV